MSIHYFAVIDHIYSTNIQIPSDDRHHIFTPAYQIPIQIYPIGISPDCWSTRW